MRKWFSGFGVALTLTAVLSISFAFASSERFWGRYDRIPEPNPPTIERDVPEAPSSATVLRWMAPSALTEWTYHKTGDNLHPDGNEQQMVWLMNRARSDPAQEGAWLATENDPDIAAARSFWHVDTTVLQNEFAAIPPKPPAAFDVRLYNAAKAHSDYLISIDGQSHTGQFDRIDAAGFSFLSAAGIVYSYSEHTVYGHAGFNIDWGPGSDGTQDPPGHRNAIMSVSGNYTNVGYAVVAESNPFHPGGPPGDHGQPLLREHGVRKPLQPLSGRHRLDRQQRQRPVRPRRGHRRGQGGAGPGRLLCSHREQRRLRHPHHGGR